MRTTTTSSLAALLAFLVCISVPAFSQMLTLKGVVINNSGEPAPGILVAIKGTDTATVTGENGTFSIAVSNVPVTLIFKGAGYESLEYTVTEKAGSKPLKITLNEAVNKLSEVVVTGYGTKRKRDVTGSVRAVASAIEFKSAGLHVYNAPIASERMLQDDTKTAAGRSKVLTAGELSDFKKWKLWEDYSRSEFAEYSRLWSIAPKNRYCVQVQNHEHKAVAGENVYLINRITKDTVWRAVSDNTGKAELWADINNTNKQEDYSITCSNQVITFPSIFENGINRITLHQPCNVADTVNIAFVTDATGSMGDEIQYLKEELQDIIGKIAAKYTGITLLTGAVFYRDHGDEYLTRHIDFQHNVTPLVEFIKRQSAQGGGDTPEAVEDALNAALDSLHWSKSAQAKLLFLILDAPPHYSAKDRLNKLLRKAAAQGIRIISVVCSGIDKSTEYLMRSMALVTNGTYVFLTDDSGVGNSHIKPTTDHFSVELLNNLMQRLIGEMIYQTSCRQEKRAEPVSNQVTNIVKLNAYPNPSRGVVNIECSVPFKEIFITDFTGKVLINLKPSGKTGKLQVDLGPYPTGTYLVKYFTEDKGWGAEKILLIH